jgi:hypothetical protein
MIDDPIGSIERLLTTLSDSAAALGMGFFAPRSAFSKILMSPEPKTLYK